jgi:hypothetical protein
MHSKKTKAILANYQGAKGNKAEFESMMEDIIDRHLSVKQPAHAPTDAQEKQEVRPASSPGSSPGSSPASSPATQIEPSLDATHTASERSVYSVLYRLTISQGKKECQITNADLRTMTGIGSHNTIREAIRGLIAKVSIEKSGGQDCSHFGARYRIYKPREILTRRRQIGIEIDPASKRIVSSPGSSPGSSPIFGRGPLPKIGDEDRALLLNDLNNKNHDDDMRAGTRATYSFLRSFFPESSPDEIEGACAAIDQLLVAEMQERVHHATTPPVSPQYFIECIRRLCSASHRPIRPKATANKRDAFRNASKRKIEALAAQLRSLHTGSTYTMADFSGDLKAACIREGIEYDADLITEVITHRQ